MSDDERTSLLKASDSRPTSVQSPDRPVSRQTSVHSTATEGEPLVDLEDNDAAKKVDIDVLTCSGSHIICQSQELSKHDLGTHMT